MNILEGKYICRTCKDKRNHFLVYEHRVLENLMEEFEPEFNSEDLYCIIKCCGCDTVSFLNKYRDDSMISWDPFSEESYNYYSTNIFPKTQLWEMIDHIELLPKKIKLIYIETVRALNSESYILAGGGLRTIIESVCNDKGIDSKKTLVQKIDRLHNDGFLSKAESKRLHSIRFIGNDALHEIIEPEEDQLLILLTIVGHLLSNLYVSDKLIEGKLDVLVESFDDFISLLHRKIDIEQHDEWVTIESILGRSIRVIKKSDLESYKEKLVSLIESGEEVSFFKSVKEKSIFLISIIDTENMPPISDFEDDEY